MVYNIVVIGDNLFYNYVGDTDQRGLDRSPGTDLAFGALTSF